MGVAASANSGTVLAVFFAPRVSEMVGWQAVFGLMLIPVGAVFAIFALLVRPDAGRARQEGTAWGWLKPVRDLLQQRATYWLGGLYAVTFGGFVGLCSFLPIFFHDQYGLNPVTAGSITAVCGLAGSAARPFGGYAADRLGGLGVAPWIFPAIVVFTAGVAMLPSPPAAVGLMVAAVAAMGFGNGVIFQIVSERFQKQMGVASGLIGAAGGLGGFFLPFCLGTLKDLTGTYRTGFLVFAGMAAVAGLSALLMRRRAGNLPGFAVDR
jgi:NNP family nitrate/nitrite transporter-like MFS transporter